MRVCTQWPKGSLVDDADITDALAVPVQQSTRPLPEGPQANGRCHWCDEIVADHLRFCDADCRDDYERQLTRRRAVKGLK